MEALRRPYNPPACSSSGRKVNVRAVRRGEPLRDLREAAEPGLAIDRPVAFGTKLWNEFGERLLDVRQDLALTRLSKFDRSQLVRPSSTGTATRHDRPFTATRHPQLSSAFSRREVDSLGPWQM